MEKPPDTPKIIITDADESSTLTVPPEVPAVVESKEVSREDVFKKEYESGKRSYAKIIKHSFVFLLVIGLGILFHNLLGWVGDPKLFDYIPWRYVLDGADATISFRLVGVIWKELGKDD